MNYPTQKDLDDARAAGYDETTIVQLQQRFNLGIRATALRLAIAHAFADVQLGDGVGLYEAQGIDGYESKENCANYRARDEKTDWRRIKLEDLNRCNSSLSFFDAAGMRFHLPAFMHADLGEDVDFDLLYHLTLSSMMEEKLALLNTAQRGVVIDYLNLALDDKYKQYSWDDIIEALQTYWNK